MKQFHLIKKYWIFTLAGFILILVLIIPLRLAIAYTYAPQPQAFFTLGGEPAREKFTAEIAQWYPSLEIWVSSPPVPEKTRKTFQAVDIPNTQLHIDTRAIDTVTNFTSLVSDFKKLQLQHLYLITSDFHMPRAKAIATLVFGSRGIAFTPLSVPSDRPKETTLHIIRDIARSLLWIVTGRTGASFNPTID
ncbi:YdcF family protein [Dendronalium sp. ChiSLP03b]|uniref:YdcF family protein n=1 Tax=Dendronalium sp. ChiSLP03b TaxID=3075381 RepID=UPI002AD40513|nr:YdcF family protein [Dendronalium sp. ChiSLP03b]MDZ8204884.1 YdcF family protein [Dendronalium sp. ChiSLP03b]